MRFVQFLGAALIAGLVPAAAGAAQGNETVVRGEARTEIERILNADNLDGTRLSPRDVVETMTAIPRGGAPEDFWTAYQTHVQAWEQFAGLADLLQGQNDETTFTEGAEQLEAAETAIETTFAEVERIARRYGARLPAPPIDTTSIA